MHFILLYNYVLMIFFLYNNCHVFDLGKSGGVVFKQVCLSQQVLASFEPDSNQLLAQLDLLRVS